MTKPSHDPDDPRLTAYALGETDEADRRAVEALLAESAESRAELEHTREIVRVLEEQYAQEHDVYLASRPEEEDPSNVIPFPDGRGRPWRRAAILSLKIAAVAMLTSSLVYLTMRTSRGPEGSIIAAKSPGLPHRATTPWAADSVQSSKDREFASQEQAQQKLDQGMVADRARAEASAPAAATPTGNTVDSALAMQRVDAADKATETAAGGGALKTFSKTESAPPADSREVRRSMSATSAPAAAPPPAKPSPQAVGYARSVVRLRTVTGVFFGGVLVSNDGLIVANTSLPESSLQQPCTAILADQSTLTTFAKPSRTTSGWYQLRIDAKETPAVTFAHEFPDAGAGLTVLTVDPSTGAATFPQIVAGAITASGPVAEGKKENFFLSVGSTAFAFNVAGELLVIDRPPDPSKTKSGQPGSGKSVARPFTNAERERLQQNVKP